nr:hypothetical protein MACL_00003081 [Theileria orientalis]
MNGSSNSKDSSHEDGPESCFWESFLYSKSYFTKLKHKKFRYYDNSNIFKYLFFHWRYVEPYKYHPLPISDQVLKWQPIFSKHVSDGIVRLDSYHYSKSQSRDTKAKKPYSSILLRALFLTIWKRALVVIIGLVLVNVLSMSISILVKRLVVKLGDNSLICIVNYLYVIGIFQHGLSHRRKFSNNIDGSNSLNVCNQVIHSCSPDSECSKNPLYCPARRYQSKDINGQIFNFVYNDSFYVSQSIEALKYIIEFMTNFGYGVDYRLTKSNDIVSSLALVKKMFYDDIAINIITKSRNNELSVLFVNMFLTSIAKSYVSFKRMGIYIKDCSPNFYISDNICTGSVQTYVVYYKDATFTWVNTRDDLLNKNYEPLLKNVNFQLKRSEIAIVTGSKGSGKSNFVKSMLGEMTLVGGSMAVVPLHTSMPIFYASEDIFLQHGTVRSNIVFGHRFDENLYKTVLSAVELESNIVFGHRFDENLYKTVLSAVELEYDISTWEKGDLRLLSDNAPSLSGGQRVRMELARAVYAYLVFHQVNKEYNDCQCSFLMCLDASFHGLDPYVSKTIFNNLFNVKTGLLVKDDLSVVLTTSKQTLDICSKMAFEFKAENKRFYKLRKFFYDPKLTIIDAGDYLPYEHSDVLLNDVCVYTTADHNPESMLLNHFNASAHRSEIIGIVGRTGAGKTILLCVLQNIMANRTGHVILDGKDLNDIPKVVLRQIIGVLPQLPFVFKGWTVRRFLDPRKLFSDADINQALNKCALLNFVNELPGGKKLDTILVKEDLRYSSHNSKKGEIDMNFKSNHESLESNVILSNTQLRTLSLARLVLYRHFYRMILVDEPPEEDLVAGASGRQDDLGVPIYDLLQKHFSHCTTFVAAHDANVLKTCTSVWVIHDGCLVRTCKTSDIAANESVARIIEECLKQF